DTQNQKGGMHAERNYVGVDENTGADNAAHDDHGGVEYSEQLARFDGIQESALGAAISRKTSRRTADGTGDHLTIGLLTLNLRHHTIRQCTVRKQEFPLLPDD